MTWSTIMLIWIGLAVLVIGLCYLLFKGGNP